MIDDTNVNIALLLLSLAAHDSNVSIDLYISSALLQAARGQAKPYLLDQVLEGRTGLHADCPLSH